ncbi:MAG: hypothetical protein DRN27_02135 [Thermoplasmata archaeon]|nr:MAG: hypothetical protein DRN27_02135 [Thermoplasmata archaeon]
MVFDRDTLVIPDNTIFNDSCIETTGDVIIGDRCLVQFGLKTDGRIFVGEHAIIDGDLKADRDIRIDIFSRIGGKVQSEGNVYLGEKVNVDGKLSVVGDLDVGDSVEIKEGFEAKGWINIRSPIPMIIYIFIYLSQLLKMGHSEEIERILMELEENDEGSIPISEIFLFIPNNAIVGLKKIKTDGDTRIGDKSTIIGNIHGKGSVLVGDDIIIQGGLHADGEIYIGKNVKLTGSIHAQKSIRIDENTEVDGNIKAKKIFLSKTVKTKGTLFSEEGTTFIEPYDYNADETLRRFEEDINHFEPIDDALE